MNKNHKLPTIEELLTSTAQFDEKLYDKTEDGYSLKPEIYEKVNARAEFRWNNGGKEIYKELKNNPEFVKSNQYQEYMNRLRMYDYDLS